MKIYCPIIVDLYNVYPLKKMTAQQNNIGRGADITLTANGLVVDPSDEVVNLYAKKPDGTISYIPCSNVNGKIRADFTNQMLAVPGELLIELQLINGEDDITTPVFIVSVQASNIDQNAVKSANEFTVLQQALSEVEELKKNGLKGDPGEAASIEIGTVTASEAGSSPQVTNVGTGQKAVLDFVLPRGVEGPAGPAGSDTSGLTSEGFDESASYKVGDFTIYKDVLYKFTSEKAAGAWDADAVIATKVDVELLELKKAADVLNSKIVYIERDFDDIAFDAGTIGTKALQFVTYLSGYASQGYECIGAFVTYISSSADLNPNVFMSGGDVYLNIYRGTSEAIYTGKASIRIVLMKNQNI